MKKISLANLKSGKKARILEILSPPALQQKLMHLGIFPGIEIAKVGQMALRGPVTIKVKRSVVALGHSMAAKIILVQE